MADKTSWTEADFDDMSWHDNHVHAFRIREGEHGTGEVELDLDYILEWLSPTEGMFSFRVAPASLTFRGVYDLQIAIDYAVVSAGLSPLCISQIALLRFNAQCGQRRIVASTKDSHVMPGGAELFHDVQAQKSAAAGD